MAANQMVMPKIAAIPYSIFRPSLGPLFYTLTIFAVIVATFVFHLRRDSIFACTADLYGGNSYLAYCGGKAYGDYDHGAFWFGLEPDARQNAAAADVLFIGNSRMEFGFSAPALGRWFSANNLKYYLLGFTHFENSTFLGPLIRGLQPRARAYVINVDDFFLNNVTNPGNDVMYGFDSTRARYETKRTWQTLHRIVCTWQPSLCGDAITIYRQRETGEWRLGWAAASNQVLEQTDRPVDVESVTRMKPIAERFISDLDVDRSCVFLTFLPAEQQVNTNRETASALARVLGLGLISPPLEGLQTFDGVHLEPDSAERFVRAFLEISGPRIQRCLGVDGRVAASPR
jgi:hypothetical protein